MKRANARSYRDLSLEQEGRAQQLQRSSLVIDAIGSSIVSPEPPIKDGKSYVERALEAGVNVLNVTLAAHADGLERFLDQAADYFDLFDARRESTLHVETIADIAKAQESGKLGVIFGVQTGSFVGTDMHLWTIGHKVGLRMAQLTYNERNLLGDGCLEPENRGLTSYGRQSIQEMNRLGICLDLSHAGERTSLEATAFSAKPVMYSHADPKAIGPGKRNITDEQMKEMAARGGVMGLSPHSMLSHKVAGVRANVDGGHRPLPHQTDQPCLNAKSLIAMTQPQPDSLQNIGGNDYDDNEYENPNHRPGIGSRLNGNGLPCPG